jgi:hypothetical protein
LQLLPLPEDEAAAKGLPLWQIGGDLAGIAECFWFALRTRLAARFPAVAVALWGCVAAQGDYFEGDAAQS